jgi:hypothetical protein
MKCHAPGDHCDRARVAILGNLTQLDGAIQDADAALRLAESAGMEVSEARLSQDQARDALTKARVTIHTFQTALVEQDIQAGMKIAAADQKAGKDAMVERNHRRIGLGVCLIAIAMMLVGLWLYIKKLES